MSTSKNHSSGKAKRSTLSGKDKVSVAREQGEGLVGSRIRVWWPLDRKFYEGVVDSYASSKKKHRVLYIDGDVETLDMKKERWEFVEEDEDEAEAEADEISLQDDSANESSDATPEPLDRKKAKSNGKVSENGRRDDAMLKKKQKIDSSDKRKSKARPGKKPEGSEEERPKGKTNVKKDEKSKDDEKQTPKPAERNGKMGDIGGKIVAAASRMSGRFQSKENGLEKEKPKTLNSRKKMSESKNSKHKRPSSSSEAVTEKVKKPKTSLKKIVSNNTDEESGEDDNDDATSDDESRPLVSYLKKSSEATEALMEKLKKKKKKEAEEESSGNEEKAVEES